MTQVNYDNLTDDIVYDKVYEKFKNIVKVPIFKETIPRNSRLWMFLVDRIFSFYYV